MHFRALLGVLGVFVALLALHLLLLRLPYYWDEAGYFIPAALDFSREWLFIPGSTLPSGHTPLVMVYLGLVWRAFGFSPLATRAAMILVAAATVASLYALGRRVAGREVAAWSAALLALCPLFFAQSSLAHLDLAAGLFTTLAVLALLRDRALAFALAASLAVLSKETAVILLPVAWLFAWWWWRARPEFRPRHGLLLASPLLPLLAWAIFYHHATGYWTGNREYLEYNLYLALSPLHFLRALPRRIEKVFIAGFNWLLVAGAIWGYARGRRERARQPREPAREQDRVFAGLLFLATGLAAAYVLTLSLVGGAILPRYLLPIFPVFFLVCLIFVWRLPRARARILCFAVAAGFAASWFINPPWPFPFEDNLSYADFVRLHQQTANFLETQAPGARVLTAWPASDELTRPLLGYVEKPRQVISLPGFTSEDFDTRLQEPFDLLYLYSRNWSPKENWLTHSPAFKKFRERFIDAAPQIGEESLVTKFRLQLLGHFERRGQWVRIYSKAIDKNCRREASGHPK